KGEHAVELGLGELEAPRPDVEGGVLAHHRPRAHGEFLIGLGEIWWRGEPSVLRLQSSSVLAMRSSSLGWLPKKKFSSLLPSPWSSLRRANTRGASRGS